MRNTLQKNQSLRSIVIIGAGSQGKAWALNLRDSGLEVCIAARKNGPSYQQATQMRFNTFSLTDHKMSDYQNFVLLTPDHTHTHIINSLQDILPLGARIIYAHGLSCTKNNHCSLFPQFEHCLLAPKAIASEVRFQYETKGKLGAVYAVTNAKDPLKSETLIKSLAEKLGITGLFPSTFKEETYADLFSEQGILCSLLPYGALLSYQKLRKKGVSQHLAFMECWLEIKLIADAMVKKGPLEFFNLISPIALLGGEKAKDLLLDDHFKNNLQQLLNDIWNEDFFKQVDATNFDQLRSDVIEKWRKEEITTVYSEIKDKVIPK